ncbi:MAG: outer membrane beta-barrel protein [Flavobacteriales bacterium]|nr:outer membrane beta-barrel protein [Flavobacteriales bacterium]
MKHLISASAALSVSAAALLVASAATAAPGEGVRMGSFIVAPSIDVVQRFDDNIFQEDANKTSDTITQIKPEVTVRSDWNRHSLEFLAGVDADLYWDSSNDNSFNGDAEINGEIDISRDVQLRLGLDYERRHDDRGSDNVNGLAEEVVIQNKYGARAELEAKFNRFRAQVGGQITFNDFEDTDLVGGGTSNEDDRDATSTTGHLELGFQARKGYEIFVRGEINKRDFNDNIDDVGIARGSDAYRVRGGVNFKPSRKLDASVSIGYLHRSFDEATFDDIDALDFAASVDWDLPNNISNIGLTVTRRVAESTDNDVAGRLTTTADLDFRHALTRSIELRSKLGYVRSEEEGGTGTRDNDTYNVGVGAYYNFNRRMTVGATYDYNRRVSNEVNEGFVQNVLAVRAKFKL